MDMEDWLSRLNLQQYTSALADFNLQNFSSISADKLLDVGIIEPIHVSQLLCASEYLQKTRSGTNTAVLTNENPYKRAGRTYTRDYAEVSHEGYLLKRGGQNNQRGWKQRWVTLSSDSIKYFGSDSDHNPLRIVNFRDILSVKPHNESDQAFSFVVTTNSDRDYIFASPTADSKESWVEAIQLAIESYIPSEADQLVGGEMNCPKKIGTLEKQGHNYQKNWVHRFVAVKEDKFAYYKSQQDFEQGNAINIISLGNVTVNALGGKKFQIVTLHKSYYFNCPSTQSCNSWVNIIRQGILQGIKSKDQSEPKLPKNEEQTAMYKKIAEENLCADCNNNDPEWVSLSLGILLCLDCSLVHRLLGINVSSLKIDSFTPTQLELIQETGSQKSNLLWESDMGSTKKPDPNDVRFTKEQFIRQKYIERKFICESEKCDGIGEDDLLLELSNCVKTNNLFHTIRLLHGENTLDVNKKSSKADGRTALHFAAKYGQPCQIELLMQNGAKCDMPDYSGKTPMQYAQESGNIKAVLALTPYLAMPTAHIESSIESKMTGFLFKQGVLNKNYQRRWIVLQDGVLSYYRSEKDSVAAGFVDVHEMVAVNAILSPDVEKFCFEIVTRVGRTYNLYALSKQDLNSWLDALEVAIAQVPDEFRDNDEDYEEILKQGSLCKRGQSNTAWKRRWFELRGKKLIYKLTDDTQNAQGSIDLRQAIKFEFENLGSEEDPLTFKIVLPSRTFVMKADNQLEFKEWMTSLKSLLYFGVELETVARREETLIPKLVTLCVESIEKREGLVLVGLFRLPGTAHVVTSMRNKFDQGLPVNIDDSEVNDAASLLKLYFRELPHSLLNGEVADILVEAAGLSNQEEKIQEYIRAVNLLDPSTYCTLFYLVEHLVRLSANKEVNKMTASNIAVCFAPTLFCENFSALKDQMVCVEEFVRLHDQVFDHSYRDALQEEFDKTHASNILASMSLEDLSFMSIKITDPSSTMEAMYVVFQGQPYCLDFNKDVTASSLCKFMLNHVGLTDKSPTDYCVAETVNCDGASGERLLLPSEKVKSGPVTWNKIKCSFCIRPRTATDLEENFFPKEKDYRNLSGYLSKEGGKIKNWRRRFFCFENERFVYYKDLKRGTEIGHFDLDLLYVYKVTNYRRSSTQFCIGLQHPSFSPAMRYICADNEYEMKSWISAINYHRVYIQKALDHFEDQL